LSLTDPQFVPTKGVRPSYDRHAATYDEDTGQFDGYRERAVSALGLRRGDTVLDVGCGTGMCFPWIQARIGPSGRLIALEPSREMLDKAMKRAARRGWNNMVPINAAAEDLDVALVVDAVLFCATHDVLRSPHALANVFRHLRPDARVAATGGKWTWPLLSPLNLQVFQLHAPYVSSFDGFASPWRNLRAHCPDLRVQTVAWDTGFLATGTAGGDTSRVLPVAG
jgi:ubiquinone/menaquinone biosynthesis C-methylase UbiE